MSGASAPLTLKFGADTSGMREAISALAADAPRNFALIAQAAIGSSKQIREGLVSAGADGAKLLGRELVGVVTNMNNVKLGAQVMAEGLKVAFAVNHPLLAIGIKLLSDYKLALLGVAVGGLALKEALDIMEEQFQAINNIIAGAAKTGTSATLFQAWIEQAAHFGLSAKEAESALTHLGDVAKKELSGDDIGPLIRAADELQNHFGLATQAYGHLHDAMTADDVQRAALELVQDYLKGADAMREQGREVRATQLTLDAGKIAAEAWGEAGYKIVDAIKSGKADIEGYVESSKQAGYVWGNDILQAQKDSNEALRIAQEHLKNEMAPNLAGLAEASIKIENIWTGIVELFAKAAHMMNEVAAATGLATTNPFAATEQKSLPDLFEFQGAGNDRHPADVPLPPKRPSIRDIERPAIVDTSKEAKAPHEKAASEQTDDVEKYIKTLEKENAALQGEADAIGKTAKERQISIDLAKAEEAAKEAAAEGSRKSAALSDEERQKIIQLAEAHVELKQKIEDATKAKQAMQQAEAMFADEAFKTVDDLITKHARLRDEIKNVARAFAEAGLKASLMGQGPLAGIFGTAAKDGATGGLFGQIFAAGGAAFSGGAPNNFAGQPAGAMGPFPQTGGGDIFSMLAALLPHFADGGAVGAVVHEGEIVMNQAQQKNLAANMSHAGSPNINVHNYAAGVDVAPQLTAGHVDFIVTSRIEQNNARLPSMLDSQSRRSS
ncbi:MAG: hypothetical protein WB816_16040 [Methylocystis sp.]